MDCFNAKNKASLQKTRYTIPKQGSLFKKHISRFILFLKTVICEYVLFIKTKIANV